MMSGIERRLLRVLRGEHRRSVVVPVDDSLIAGPSGGLRDMPRLMGAISTAQPDAILGFPRQLATLTSAHAVRDIALIANLTASTTRSSHTRKVEVGSVRQALRYGCDAVAVHVNLTARHEHDMLRILGKTIEQADRMGVPVLAIMYPRRQDPSGADDNYTDLRADRPGEYTELVAHAVRVAADLGASLIKTQYTGDTETFRNVVEAARGVPVLIAGGPMRAREEAIEMARGAMDAGASGISFGRNVFNRDDPAGMISDLLELVHGHNSIES